MSGNLRLGGNPVTSCVYVIRIQTAECELVWINSHLVTQTTVTRTVCQMIFIHILLVFCWDWTFCRMHNFYNCSICHFGWIFKSVFLKNFRKASLTFETNECYCFGGSGIQQVYSYKQHAYSDHMTYSNQWWSQVFESRGESFLKVWLWVTLFPFPFPFPLIPSPFPSPFLFPTGEAL